MSPSHARVSNLTSFLGLYNIDISIEEFKDRDELATYYHDEDNEEDSNRIAISKNYIEQTNKKLVKEDAIINEVSNSNYKSIFIILIMMYSYILKNISKRIMMVQKALQRIKYYSKKIQQTIDRN